MLFQMFRRKEKGFYGSGKMCIPLLRLLLPKHFARLRLLHIRLLMPSLQNLWHLKW